MTRNDAAYNMHQCMSDDRLRHERVLSLQWQLVPLVPVRNGTIAAWTSRRMLCRPCELLPRPCLLLATAVQRVVAGILAQGGMVERGKLHSAAAAPVLLTVQRVQSEAWSFFSSFC